MAPPAPQQGPPPQQYQQAPQQAPPQYQQAPQQGPPPVTIIHTQSFPNYPIKSRGCYIILALLFGLFGFHNFYIGRASIGCLQLALTICIGWLIIPLPFLVLWVFIYLIWPSSSYHPHSIPHLSFVASLLEFQELSEFVTERMSDGLKHFDDNRFQLDRTSLISELIEVCPKDVRVSYKNTVIDMNSVILAIFSKTFYNSFNCDVSNQDILYFEYDDEFPDLCEDLFCVFFKLFYFESVEFTVLNILDFLQLSNFFQVQELSTACTQYLSDTSFSESDLVQLLKISNDINQLNFVKDNIQLFASLSTISTVPIPLKVSFIQCSLGYVNESFLFKCLIKGHKMYDLKVSELEAVLNTPIAESNLFEICQILEPLFEVSAFIPTLVHWSMQHLKNVEHFNNIPPSWFLYTLSEVDNCPHFSNYLDFLCDVTSSVITPQFLEINSFSPSSTCLELLCSKLPGDYCLFLVRNLVKSWKNSNEVLPEWTVDRFVRCVKSISIGDVGRFQFLKILMELQNIESLQLFINSFVATNSLALLSSHENRLKIGSQTYLKGLTYFNGISVIQNYEKALSLFQEAEKLNHLEAIFKIGSCYFLGLGVTKNFEKASQYFKKSAELGHVFGMINFGCCLCTGQGVEENKQEAFRWFKNAADLDSSEGICWLSACYDFGYGVKQDCNESLKWLTVAAKLGNAQALNDLGYCYDEGHGVDQNSSVAVKYFQMASDRGSSTGMKNLGVKYKKGFVVERNYQKAFELFQKSALLNNVAGIEQLILCFNEGVGCDYDADLARYWVMKMQELKGTLSRDDLIRRGLL
ncbi:hypothetical protein GEMRC1_010853 [Eukaryota sp. GEM-RC1]